MQITDRERLRNANNAKPLGSFNKVMRKAAEYNILTIDCVTVSFSIYLLSC